MRDIGWQERFKESPKIAADLRPEKANYRFTVSIEDTFT
jgi:hypothetical protein